jgi:ABC-type bacteriocin/lantibiotic exporter with double-glycine peptidase domain
LKFGFYHALFPAIQACNLFFKTAVSFGLGTVLIKSGGFKSDQLVSYLHVNGYNVYGIRQIFHHFHPDIKTAIQAVNVTRAIASRIPKIDSLSDSGLKPADLRGDIEFPNVYSRYPTRKNCILKGLNMKNETYRTVALVGQSGCGKSTIVQILLRFYNIDQGSVTIDGFDIHDLNIKWLGSQIGLVAQEPVLFNTTITDNLQIGSPNRENVNIVQCWRNPKISREFT